LNFDFTPQPESCKQFFFGQSTPPPPPPPPPVTLTYYSYLTVTSVNIIWHFHTAFLWYYPLNHFWSIPPAVSKLTYSRFCLMTRSFDTIPLRRPWPPPPPPLACCSCPPVSLSRGPWRTRNWTPLLQGKGCPWGRALIETYFNTKVS
jgi:hypothetical protein